MMRSNSQLIRVKITSYEALCLMSKDSKATMQDVVEYVLRFYKKYKTKEKEEEIDKEMGEEFEWK